MVDAPRVRDSLAREVFVPYDGACRSDTRLEAPIDAEHARTEPRDGPSIRQIVLSGIGLLLIQLTWIACVPAYGGSDEFDHAYRAAAVARGAWVPEPTNATRGTGAWLQVPVDIVEAAREECQTLPYTTDVDCVGTTQGDSVRIASGAGRYHPLFYALIGWPALPFEGENALYAMRVANALLCNGFFVLGLLMLRRWSTGRWPMIGALVGCTPVLVYSASIAAPNGVEMTAAFAFWASVLGLLRGRSTGPGVDRVMLVAATLSGSMLVTVRSLGPLWCLLIVATAMVATPGSFARVWSLLRDRIFLGGLVVLSVAGVASLAWIRMMSSLVVGVGEPGPSGFWTVVGETAQEVPLWVFQTVAAFPYRNQVSPPVVYATILVLTVALAVAGWRAASRRMRWALLVCLLLAVAVPFVITAETMDTHPRAWQGRYGLPYSLGLPLLAGIALQMARRKDPRPRLVLIAAALGAVATSASLIGVIDVEKRASPSFESGIWNAPSPVLVVIVAVVGVALSWAPAVALGSPVVPGRRDQSPTDQTAVDRPDHH